MLVLGGALSTPPLACDPALSAHHYLPVPFSGCNASLAAERLRCKMRLECPLHGCSTPSVAEPQQWSCDCMLLRYSKLAARRCPLLTTAPVLRLTC